MRKAREQVQRDLESQLTVYNELCEEGLIEKAVLADSFMKTLTSLKSKVEREDAHDDDRKVATLFARDVFRMRVQMTKKGEVQLDSEDIIRVLDATKSIADGKRILQTRVKPKIVQDEWPKQYIFNFWHADCQAGIEVQVMLC